MCTQVSERIHWAKATVTRQFRSSLGRFPESRVRMCACAPRASVYKACNAVAPDLLCEIVKCDIFIFLYSTGRFVTVAGLVGYRHSPHADLKRVLWRKHVFFFFVFSIFFFRRISTLYLRHCASRSILHFVTPVRDLILQFYFILSIFFMAFWPFFIFDKDQRNIGKNRDEIVRLTRTFLRYRYWKSRFEFLRFFFHIIYLISILFIISVRITYLHIFSYLFLGTENFNEFYYFISLGA